MIEDLSGFPVEEKPPADAPGDVSVPAVTVVTVVFNALKAGRRESLAQCLDSVQRQAGVTVEHVVIDGASGDGTVDFVRSCRNGRSPVRLLSAPDEGIYHAMNRGLALARGRYVLFLNSDDFLHDSQALAKSASRLDETGADFSYAPAVVLDGSGKPVGHPYDRACPYQAGPGMTICHQSVLTRREALLKMDGFSRAYRFSADFDLLMRMVLTGCRACRVADPVVTFRSGGCSTENSEAGYRETGRIYAALFNRHLGTALTPDFCERFAREGYVPEYVWVRYRPFAVRTFGAEYAPGEDECKRLCRAYDRRLERALTGAALDRLVPSRILRGALGRMSRLWGRLGERIQDRCRREVEGNALRAYARECVSDCKDVLFLSSGVEVVGDMRFSRRLPADFCRHGVTMTVLMKVSCPAPASARVRIVFDGGQELVSVGCDGDLQPVRIDLPASAVRDSVLQFTLGPDEDSPDRESYLVVGGLAVWK